MATLRLFFLSLGSNWRFPLINVGIMTNPFLLITSYMIFGKPSIIEVSKNCSKNKYPIIKTMQINSKEIVIIIKSLQSWKATCKRLSYLVKFIYSEKATKFWEIFPKIWRQIVCLIKLNQYETAPYFIQFSKNLTCNCLLISVFCPKFP